MATKINDASNFGDLPLVGRQLVRDSNGYLWAILADPTNSHLEMWRSADNGSTWSEQDSANKPSTGSPDVCAVAIDSNDVLHVAYNDGDAYDLHYITFGSGGWGTSTYVYTGIIDTVDIAVDSNNVPHIVSFQDTAATDKYVYANRVGGSWNTVDVASQSALNEFSASITINHEDKPVIVGATLNHTGAGETSIEAWLGNANNATSFSSKIIDTTANTSFAEIGGSVATDSSGDVWIAYSDSDGHIILAKQSANWTDAWTIYDSGGGGDKPSLFISGDDKYVFYEQSGLITYRIYNGGWGSTSQVQIGTYQDVKTIWASALQYDKKSSSIVDSYSESNQDGDFTFSAVDTDVGQTFEGNGGVLKSVELYLKKTGTPNTVSVEIYETTGTYGTNAVPTGSPIATSETVTVSEIGTSYSLVKFNFTGDNAITLTNGTKYALVIDGAYNGPGNTIIVGRDGSSPSHAGNLVGDGGGGWYSSSAYDLIFYVRSYTKTLSSLNTYYFDGSDGSTSDPNSVWSNDTNIDDGSTTTSATTTTDGSVSSNYLHTNGTNAPQTGGTIVGVKARVYAGNGSVQDWGDWLDLSTPTGGWTWAKLQALEAKAYKTAPFNDWANVAIYTDSLGELLGTALNDVGVTGTVAVFRIELLVYTSDSPSGIDYLFSDNTDVYYDFVGLGHTVSVDEVAWTFTTGGTTYSKTVTAKSRIKTTETQTITAKARVEVSETKIVQSKARIQIGKVASITSKARIKVINNDKTIISKSRIKRLESGTVQSKARIQILNNIKTAQSKARIQTIEIYDNTHAKARIKFIGSSATIQAKAKIFITGVNRTIEAKAKLLTISTNTVTAKARINVSQTETVQVKGNIKALKTSTINTKARIKYIGEIEAIQAKASIKNFTSQSIESKSRILRVFANTVQAKSRVLKLHTETITAKARIKVPDIVKTLQGKACIKLIGTIVTTNAKADIKVPNNIDTVQAKARVKVINRARSIQSKARIEIADNTQTIQSKARIKTDSVVKTIQAKASIKNTSVQTSQAKADIKATIEKTVQVKARIETGGIVSTITAKADIKIVNVDKTITARSRIHKLVEVTATAKARIKRVLDTSIMAKSRIATLSITKSIESRASIKGTLVKTIQAKANVFKGFTKTVQAKARIKLIDLVANIQAKSRIKILGNDKTSQAKARIEAGGVIKTVQSLSRILVLEARTITAKATIKVLDNSSTINAKSRIESAGVTQSIQGKARIKVINVTSTVQARSRIEVLNTETIQAKARILIPYTKTITARSRIKTLNNVTIQSKARLETGGIVATITSKARIKVTDILYTIQAKSNVKNTLVDHLQAKARITQIVIATTQAKANIKNTLFSTVQAKSNIKATTNQTIQAKARVLYGNAKAIQAKASIKILGVEKTIQAKARIKLTHSETITARGRVKVVDNSSTITAKSNIKNFITGTVTAKARVQRTEPVTIQSKARIEIGIVKSINAKSAIKVLDVTRTVQGRARIKVGIIKSIGAKARIEIADITKTIQAKANISAEGVTQTVSAKALIEVIGTETKTIQAKSRIKNIGTKTTQAKANIKSIGVTQTLSAKAYIEIPWYLPTALNPTLGSIVSGELSDVYINDDTGYLTLEELQETITGSAISDTPLGSDSDLAAYWKYDTATGMLVDSSPNGYTLSNSNVVSADGKFSESAEFNGTNASLNASVPLGNLSGDQSWVFWIYIDTEPVGVDYITGFSTSAPSSNKGLYTTSTKKINTGLVGVSPATLTTTNAMNLGEWNHVAFVYEAGSNYSLFLNGVKTNVACSGTLTTGSNLFGIGRIGAFNNYYTKCRIDDYGIIRRKLTDEEVGWLANGYTPRVPLADTPLNDDPYKVAHYELESDGSDSSSNSYDLTTTRAPAYVEGNLSDYCADFDQATSEYLTIANASCPNLEMSGEQSWAFWFNPQSLIGTSYVLGKATVATNGWLGFRVTSTYIDFYMEGLTTNEYVRANVSITPDTWNHIAGIYDPTAGKLKIYVNNVKTEVTASGSHDDSNGDFSIGRLGAWTGGVYEGKVNDVVVFSRGFTDEEVGWLSDGYAPVIGNGFDYDFTFENVPEARRYQLELDGHYTGQLDHNIYLYQWNYTLSQWDRLTTNSTDIPYTVSDSTLEFITLDGSDYYDSGEIKIRILHDDLGDATHTLVLDLLKLSELTHIVDVTAKARIEIADIAKTLQARARIKATSDKTVQGKARIKSTGIVSTIQTRASIKQTDEATISAKAFINHEVTQTIQAKAKIRIELDATIQAKAKVVSVVNQAIQGKAYISKLGIVSTIDAKASIKNTVTQSILVKAKIRTSGSYEISAKAFIYYERTETISAMSKILRHGKKFGRLKKYGVVTILDRKGTKKTGVTAIMRSIRMIKVK